MIASKDSRRLVALSASCALACAPSVGPGPQQPERKVAIPETLAASPPPGPAPPVTRAPVAGGALECVAPPDPELDAESPWSQELGQRLDAELPKLGRCSVGLSSGDEALVTIRLVYGQDGTPISQHVVRSSSNGCPVIECLKEELAKVQSSKLMIESASYDLALVLQRGVTPRRASEPPDALADGSADDPASCVDPAVLRLSRTAVREVVSTRYDELTACYTQALSRDHHATGNVTFELVIGRQGELSSAQAREATLYDCPAINCMLDQLRTLSFPAPVGRSVRVIYPIRYVVEQESVSLR